MATELKCGPVLPADLDAMLVECARMRVALRDICAALSDLGSRASVCNSVTTTCQIRCAEAQLKLAAEAVLAAHGKLDSCRHVDTVVDAERAARHASITDDDRAVAADGRA